MTFRQTVASNLAKLISESGKAKIQIADELGVEQAVISKYTNGTSLPSPEKIKNLCEILQCDYSHIMGTLEWKNFS